MTEIETGYGELGYTEIISTDITKITEPKIVIKGAYSLLSKMKNSEEEGTHAH